VLVVLSAIDLEHRIVPNRIVVPAAAIVLLAQTALHPSPEWTLGALGASGFLLLAALAYPGRDGHGRRQARAAAGRDARTRRGRSA
jgi:Flp pilus assembly protein protease CpaA